MLGVFFTPVGDGMHHMAAVKEKGLNWLDKCTTKPLPNRDAWLSFFMQLYLAISHGLAAVKMRPKKLEKIIQSLSPHPGREDEHYKGMADVV